MESLLLCRSAALQSNFISCFLRELVSSMVTYLSRCLYFCNRDLDFRDVFLGVAAEDHSGAFYIDFAGWK